MFKSKDGLIRIDVAEDLSEVAFPPADFSIVNVPVDHEEAEDLFNNLYNTPTNRHVSLILNRHRRSERLKAMSNLDRQPFTYLDSVHLWYERASSSSNNGFLPISEQGLIVYKGSAPDVKRTSWFGDHDGNPNATTLWNLAPSQNEPSPHTYFQKFSWEMGLLLYSMSAPLEHNKFIYGFDLDSDAENLFFFCKEHGIEVQLYTRTSKEASELLERYKNLK